MKVKLTEIKAATPRVRKELNLDKLDELAESIKETGGVIVPVKLRINGGAKEKVNAALGGDAEYTTVYGHRRIEACRMAGLTEVEAFIEDMDDSVLLTQALIENVVREDMAPIDVAKALQQVKLENEWTDDEVGTIFGHSGRWVGKHIEMLKPEFSEVMAPSLTTDHLTEAKAGTDDDADAVKVLEKAAAEGLSQRQTRTVAEEYKRMKNGYGAKAANKVLTTPYERSGLQPFTPVHKPAPVVKPVGEILFQWVRDQRVIDAEIGLRAISACVSDINRSTEDRGGGKAVLKNLIGRTEIVLNQMHEVLDAYDK